MRVLVFERNLMWSSRLVQSLKKLGHEPVLVQRVPSDPASAAIVNLGEPEARELVQELRRRGMTVIAHAGHKEKELHELGREAGADILATNSQLTFKLADLLAQVEIPD